MNTPTPAPTLTQPPAEPDGMFCIGCRYPLRGLPQPRCRECGRAFDPADGTTWSLQPLPWWMRLLMKPPVWLITALAVPPTLLGLACYSIPGDSVGLSDWCWITWAAFAMLPPVRFIVFHIGVPVYFGSALPRIRQRCWLGAVILLLAMILLRAAEVPSRIAFRISKPRLEATARSILDPGTGSPPVSSGWIGAYRFDDVGLVEVNIRRRSDLGGGTLTLKPVLFWFDEDWHDTDAYLAYCSGNPLTEMEEEDRKGIVPLGEGLYLVRTVPSANHPR